MASRLTLFLLPAVAACATLHPESPRVARQLEEVGTGYGVVVSLVPADNKEDRTLCAEGKVHPTAIRFCDRLEGYNVATVNVAATTGKSFLKGVFLVERSVDLKKGDIVKFRFEDAAGYIKLASRGETPTCRWAGSPPIMIGFPFQQGGVECEGWSYKQVLHIDWLRG